MNTVDSLGRAVSQPTPLIDNVRQQIAQMRAMNKKAGRLRIDLLSWDALLNEIVPLMPMYPVSTNRPKLFGLEIQIVPESDFEVVE